MRNWINEQVKLAEEAERKGDIKELYNITRKLSKRKFRISRPVKTKSGTLLTTQEQLKRWEEHFSKIFNNDDDKAGSKQEMRKVKDNNSEN